MNQQQARQLAETAVANLTDGDHQPVAEATIVGLTNGEFWVTDNGEEVNSLTRQQAIDVIVENLAGEDE